MFKQTSIHSILGQSPAKAQMDCSPGEHLSSNHVLFLDMHSAQNGNTCMTSCMQFKNNEGYSFGTDFLKGGGCITVAH